MSSGNIYTFNNGSKQIKDIQQDDIIYDGFNNTFTTLGSRDSISKKYENILELNIFKTRPIHLTSYNKVLTIKKHTDKQVWKNIDELTITDYVAITTKKLLTVRSNNEDKYLLMGIYISCGKIENNKLIFKLNDHKTLYDFSKNNDSDYNSDYNMIINIVRKLFNINNINIKINNDEELYEEVSFDLNDKINEFIDNIDKLILNVKNYNDLHKFVEGLHFNNLYTRYELWSILKNNDSANKYYNILRTFGMDVEIKDNKLRFNSRYASNMNCADINHPVSLPSNNVISCFYNDNLKCYSIDYTFLKVMSVIDTNVYEQVSIYNTNDKCYNIENIIIK